jgi:hypothetical protein
VGVSRRMPGVSVVNPSSNKDRSQIRSASQSPRPLTSRGRSRSASSTDLRRERSVSSSRTKGGQDYSISKSDGGGGERQRTSSTPASRRPREEKTTRNHTSTEHHRSRSASTSSRQRILIETVLLSAKAEASSERGYNGVDALHRHPATKDALAVGSSNAQLPSFHSRALEFTSKALTTTSPLTAPRETSTTPIISQDNPVTPPIMVVEQGIQEVDKFDDSDPFIIIPAINHNGDCLPPPPPPPPPPRSAEEMARHMERLKLRQASLRKEYQERRAKMAAVTRSSKSDVVAPVAADPPPIATDSTRRSKSRNQEQRLTKPDENRYIHHKHHRSLTDTSEPARCRATSPRRSRQATTSGRGRHSKDELVASSSRTRARSTNHRDSSREKITSTAGEKSSKTPRSGCAEKSPRVSKGIEQDDRRLSSHEMKRSLRSKSIEHNSSRSLSRTKERLYSGDEGHRSDRSRATSRKSSKEGHSTLTGSTKPESVSSTSQSKSTVKIVLSRSRSKEVDANEESQLIVFQRKKRAHRQGGKGRSKNDDYDSISHQSQPVALVHCSSDEQSHASSISESMCTNEFDAKDRSLLLSFTKGGAKEFVTRSKSALGGLGSLNSARRKFQSSLLV